MWNENGREREKGAGQGGTEVGHAKEGPGKFLTEPFAADDCGAKYKEICIKSAFWKGSGSTKA